MSDSSADFAEPSGTGRGAVGPLLIACLLTLLGVLAYSAFPRYTMRFDEPVQSWPWLAGAMAVFAAWVWPMGRWGGSPWRGALAEALMLALAGAAVAVPAVWWTGASRTQVAAAGVYVLTWLAASMLAIASAGRPGRGVVLWVYAAVMTLANWGLLAGAYFADDLLDVVSAGWLRWCPMAQSARLAETGWPIRGNQADWLAFVTPVGVVLILLATAMLGRRADRST